MAEIVRRRSWGGVLPLGRHVSISGSRSIHAPSVSIAPSSFQEEQNARHHKQFKLEQALGRRIFVLVVILLIAGMTGAYVLFPLGLPRSLGVFGISATFALCVGMFTLYFTL